MYRYIINEILFRTNIINSMNKTSIPWICLSLCSIAETPLFRISKPGEIRSEYEAELERLRAERLRLEQQEFDKTELLIRYMINSFRYHT